MRINFKLTRMPIFRTIGLNDTNCPDLGESQVRTTSNRCIMNLSYKTLFLTEAKMNFLVWIIFGALAGWIASMVMGKNKQMGALANIVVGIIGAWLGSWVFGLFGAAGVTGFNLQSIVVAIVGAVVLLFVVGLFRR